VDDKIISGLNLFIFFIYDGNHSLKNNQASEEAKQIDKKLREKETNSRRSTEDSYGKII
jgi:hypothetical protein